MKILKHFMLIMLLVLLVGAVSAEDISNDTGTYDISESVQDSSVPDTNTLTAQTDESRSDNNEKNNERNVKSEEEGSVNSWTTLVKKIDSVRNSTEDMTITLDEGTFTNNGTVYWESDNPIVLTIDGNGQCIDGNEQQVFNISMGSSLVLKNIIIKNASSRYGGAIMILSNVDTNVIINSYFKNNTAEKGGSIEVYDNFNRNEGNISIEGNVFTENSATMGGAIYMVHSGFITNNLFTNNVVSSNVSGTSACGAILLKSYFEYYSVNLINNTFSDNTAENGGFGGAVGAQGYTLLNSYNDTFNNNTAESDGFGGAVCTWESALFNVSYGTFKNNWAIYAGAIFSNSMLDVTDSEFLENCADYGGAIFSLDAKVTVRNSKFKDLYANRSGGAIGIKYDFEFDTSISGMTSKDEGSNLSEVIIENCEFSNVSSKNNGGAICFSDLQEYPDCIFVIMRVNNSTFADCESEYGGAILKLNGNLTINNSVFDGISAYESGGAIYTSQANLDIMNSSFADYMANTDGEAIYLDKGLLSISDSAFYDEGVSENSSSIYVYDSSMYLKDSYFKNPESTVIGVFVNDYIMENTTLNEDNLSLNNTDYVTATTYHGKKLELINQTYVDEIPASYDSRDYGLVTPVKDQLILGACAAFANIAAIESALLKQTGTEYDLSENNLHSNILKYSKYSSELACEGITSYESVPFALNWIGVIPEEYDEYDSLGTITKIFDTDDKIRVQDVMIIFSGTQDRDKLIKEAILNYGAVTASINGCLDAEYWNPETNSIYYPDSREIDHILAVVGWDDNYSRENFLVTPPGDGAWILKNSYGPNKYEKGYLYMSYYDKSFMESEDDDEYPEFATVYVFNNTIKYKTNYQTDINGLLSFDSNYTYYSNMYTAYYNESLAAVGTYFNESGVDYEFNIYVNGKHVLSQNGTSNYAGYKTIILDRHIPVMEGDTFKVVFKNNNVPYLDCSRQHYLKNISFISADGENWEDMSEDNQTVCLKVYTVETTDDNDTNDTNDTPTPRHNPVRPKEKNMQTYKTTHSDMAKIKTYTIRLVNDNTIVYTGNALTLEALNRIFDLNFTRGHLLVYLDGVLLFNDTTTDDVTMVILELLDKYSGEHEIKVVFTDNENHTDIYKQNILIG